MQRFALYTGCVSKGGCPELYSAIVKVADMLGIELEEMKDVGCTGAGVLSQEVSDPINARTLAKAEAMGLPLMTICSTCTGVLGIANHRLKSDPEYREEINREYLDDMDLEYKGTTDVKHFLWALVEDFGIDELKARVQRPLSNFKISPFYGCYLRRPDESIQIPARKRYLEQVIEAVGGEVVDISGKGKCCGFPILMAEDENAMLMSAKHSGEARDKGANCMVTPCPLCHLNLDGNQPMAEKVAKRDIDMPILHLPQLVGLALGASPTEMELQRHIVSTKVLSAQVDVLT